MKNAIIILTLLFFGCSTKKGVFYDEMSKSLSVKFSNDKLILQTGNSKTHSAYLIYEVKAKADITKKELYITGMQAIHKDYKDRFEIDLKKLGITNIQDYKIIWIDPDKKQTNLQLEKN